jgi:ectoine hydroxylase-related dioxygenase (phytanoyl-CoA dioxygenase family)
MKAMQDPTLRLADEQLDFYRQNGYLALDALTTQKEVARIREIYDRLFEERVGRERGDQFDLAGADDDKERAKLPQILGPSNYAPELKDTLAWANAGAIMEQLLGGPLTGQGDHAILKPAGYGASTPWHQDEAYWNPAFDHYSLSVWMPLQDVDARSGCMHFVPGSHLTEVAPHRPIGGDPRVHGLEVDPDAQVDVSKAVGIPLKAGGCTIHHQRTLHFAPPNTSDQPRRAWILMGSREATPREVAHNYYWQQLWQTAREQRARNAR